MLKQNSFTLTFVLILLFLTSTTVIADTSQSTQFSDDIFVEHTGDIVEITITTNADTTRIQFGTNQASGYSHNVTLSNINSYTITLLFDTSKTDDNESPWSLKNPDAAEITPGNQETQLTHPIEPHTYTIYAFVNNKETDRAAVRLEQPSVSNISTYTLPRDTSITDDQLANRISTQNIAVQDHLIIQVNASGIYSSLNKTTTADDLEKHSQHSSKYGYYIVMEDTDTGKNKEPKQYSVGKGKLFVDSTNDTFYLVYDTEELNVSPGETPEITFVTEEYGNVTTNTTITQRSLQITNNKHKSAVTVEKTTGLITARTTLAPTTEVTVRIKSKPGEPDVFNKAKSVTVTENRTLSVAFETSSYQEETEFTIVITGGISKTVNGVFTNTSQKPSVRILVVDENYNPIENATVSIAFQTYTTDKNGRITVQVPPGEYNVRANKTEYVANTTHLNVSSDIQETIILTQQPPNGTYTFSVKVTDYNGTPIKHARINIDTQTYTTNSNGIIRTQIPPDEYTVEVTASGYKPESELVNITNNSTITFKLERKPVNNTETQNPTDTITLKTPTVTKNSTKPPNTTKTNGQPGLTFGLALILLLVSIIIADSSK